MASNHASVYWATTSSVERPSSFALRMILSSMSVMFDTYRTSRPRHSR